jgi:hypothetical protein
MSGSPEASRASSRALVLVVVVVVAWSVGACELVIDVPAKPNLAADAGDSGRAETPRKDAAVDSTPPLPTARTDAAKPDHHDASAPRPDAPPSDHVPDGGRDALPPGRDAACTGTVYAWYADDDRDGYGRSGTTADVRFDCASPGPTWAKVAGDCADDNPLVHPNQVTYFGAPYARSDGTPSFDYDCSNFEDGDPTALIAPKSCGLLSLTLCGGAGYAATNRTGFGLNEYCGSGVWSTCEADLGILVCKATGTRRDPPYGCR